MNRFLLLCLLSFAACANTLAAYAADKSEKPLSVTFTQGPNGAPRTAIFIAGEPVYMKAVAKNFAVPKTGKCLLSVRHYIVDKEDKIVYSHPANDTSTRVAIGDSDAKLLLKCPVTMRTEPGEYFFVTEIRDRETSQIYRNRQSFLIIPWDEFALAHLIFTSAVDKSVVLGPSFEVGQQVLFNWTIQSPQVDDDGNWRISTKLRVYNKVGKDVIRPNNAVVSEFSANSRGILPGGVGLNVTTPGEYYAEVEIEDLNSGKVIKKAIPFRIFDSLAGIPRAPTL